MRSCGREMASHHLVSSSRKPTFIGTLTCTTAVTNDDAHVNARAPRRPRRREMAREGARHVGSLQLGENLIGIVRHVGGADSAWLDIGCSTSTGKAVNARLHLKSYRSQKQYVPNVGAVVPVQVSRLNVPAGRVEVVRGRFERKVRSVEDSKRLQDLVIGEQLTAHVLAVTEKGAVVDVGVSRERKKGVWIPCTGLLHRKHFLTTWASAADRTIPDDVERVVEAGDTLQLYVRLANPQSCYLFMDAAPITAEQVQRERANYLSRMKRRRKTASVETLKPGELRRGFVHDVKKYGCFVDLGLRKNGLLHYSQMGKVHRRSWKSTVPKGADVIVKVLEVDGQNVSLQLLGLVEEVRVALETTSMATARLGNSEEAEYLRRLVGTDDGAKHDDYDEDENDVEDDVADEALNDFGDKFTDDYFESKYL